MSDVFIFGVGQGELDLTADTIEAIDQLGATLYHYSDPGGPVRHWFTARGYGDPFDRQLARDVAELIAKDGVL